MKLKKKIISLIKCNNDIALFFHEYPDGDALGSVFGFYSFIKKKYPKKNINIIGIDELDNHYLNKFLKFEPLPNYNDEWISKSLGIVFDCANSDRVFTKKHLLCNKTIVIDHHISNERYGNINWVNEKYSSCCEMVSKLLLKWSPRVFDNTIASFLYLGMVTDTNRFFYSCTTARTLKIASKLYKYMSNPASINLLLNERTVNEIKFNNIVQSLINFDLANHIAYLLIPENIFEEHNIFPNSMIWLMSNINDIEIWTSLYYDKTNNVWKGSLRSKTLDISPIASKFNGGGHKNASGFKLDNKADFNKVIDEIKKCN